MLPKESGSHSLTETLVLHPHAKINLGLIIKGRREDGYHLLETLLYPFRDMSDELSLTPLSTPGCELEMTGIPIEGHPEDNLCVKAYQLLQEQVPGLPGVHLRLTKNIPAGAGLGGGSSDAAATLRGLNELFNLGLGREILSELAARLGADVPFFLYDEPMLARGIGTELQPFDLELPGRIEVVTTGIHSATAAAYRDLDLSVLDPARELTSVLTLPLAAWKDQLVNDLEGPVFARFPELARQKNVLYDRGALYAAMSGSGSALFGIFPE